MSAADRRSVSVITGGGGGMGLATAEIIGRDQLVVLADLDQERLDRAAARLLGLGITCESQRCDVTDERSVADLARRAGELGVVHSLVHTAGISPHMGTAEQILRVNALGTVVVDQAFVRFADEGFAIVNVASSAGHLPALFPVPRGVYRLAYSDPELLVKRLSSRCDLVPARLRAGIAYSVSKNFVIWYSRRLAAALGARGTRVLSVSPGSFDTEMGRLEESSGAGQLAERSALGRFGRVEEIAEVLAFVASERAGYLTGADVLVDGGSSAAMTFKDMVDMARSL